MACSLFSWDLVTQEESGLREMVVHGSTCSQRDSVPNTHAHLPSFPCVAFSNQEVRQMLSEHSCLHFRKPLAPAWMMSPPSHLMASHLVSWGWLWTEGKVPVSW